TDNLGENAIGDSGIHAGVVFDCQMGRMREYPISRESFGLGACSLARTKGDAARWAKATGRAHARPLFRYRRGRFLCGYRAGDVEPLSLWPIGRDLLSLLAQDARPLFRYRRGRFFAATAQAALIH